MEQGKSMELHQVTTLGKELTFADKEKSEWTGAGKIGNLSILPRVSVQASCTAT